MNILLSFLNLQTENPALCFLQNVLQNAIQMSIIILERWCPLWQPKQPM